MPETFKYIIVDMFSGVSYKTNSEGKAERFSRCEGYCVINAETQQVVARDELLDIEVLE